MTNTEHTTCQSCQTESKQERGEEVTQQERNHWSLWGCTCDSETSREAQEWVERVTR